MKRFTIIIFTENHIGLLNRVTTLFTQRHINIESLTVSESEEHGIHRFTVMIEEEEERVRKVVKQIQKQVEVIKAEHHTDEEIIFQEIALYKIPMRFNNGQSAGLEGLIRQHHARILAVEAGIMTIEKTGHKEDTEALLQKLRPFGVLEFVRSGRVAITRSQKKLSEHLEVIDAQSKNISNN